MDLIRCSHCYQEMATVHAKAAWSQVCYSMFVLVIVFGQAAGGCGCHRPSRAAALTKLSCRKEPGGLVSCGVA